MSGKNQNNTATKEKLSNTKYWNDIILQKAYSRHFSNLSSQELDEEIFDLIGSFRLNSSTDLELYKKFVSIVLEFYINKKIKKEINLSLKKILEF